MSSATIAIDSEASVTHSELGWSFIHWGLGLFIAGFVVGYVPIVHYMLGAQAGNVGPVFLKNITLWWGCPGILAEMIVKHGSLGMLGIGLCYLAAARQGASSIVSSHERIAVKLCAYGLIAEIVAAAVGYVVCNTFWPDFYYAPVETGKNVWLAAQGLSVTVFFVGVCYAAAGIRRAASQLR